VVELIGVCIQLKQCTQLLFKLCQSNRTPAIYTGLRSQSFPVHVLSDTNRYVIC